MTLLLLACLGASPAWSATVSVSISGVSPEIESNIRAVLDLSRHAARTDLSEAGIRRLNSRARRQIIEAMRPYGFYRPEIRSRLEPSNGNWQVIIEIDPGEPVRITELDIRLEGEGKDDPALLDIIRQSELEVGKPLFHPDYDRLRTRLQGSASNYGYFEAEFRARRLEVDPDALSARVVLHLQTGPRYRLGELRIEQDVIDPDLLERVVDLRPGDPYAASDLLRSQYRLTDTMYFAGAVAETGDADPDTRTVPVSILTTPSRRQRIRIGVGYATDTRLRGSLDVDWRRLNRSGHSARASLSGSSELLELSGRYRIPIGDPLKERLLIRANVAEEELGDLTSRRADVGLSLDTKAGRSWQRSLFADILRERTKLGDETMDDFLVVPGVAFEKLQADDVLFPRDGYRFRVELRGSVNQLGATTSFGRLELAASRVFSVGPDWRFFLRGELGAGLVDNSSDLPASQRFFAGGDQSVRGYDYNSLGPRDEEGNLVGGRHLVFASFEAERRVWRRIALAAFVDTGNAVENFGDDLEASAGVGVHVQTPIGTLRLSIARSITEDRDRRYHLTLRPDL